MSNQIRANILNLIGKNFKILIKEDKKNIFYLLYYSIIEAILFMIAPLTSAMIINSVLAHATLSIGVLSSIVIIVFSGITTIQIFKQYILEKLEQKIFVRHAIELANNFVNVENSSLDKTTDKYMNYFFDVISIQKLFPSLILSASSLLFRIIMGIIVLLIFDVNLFILSMFFITLFTLIILFLGRNGIEFAILRSNAKHEAIYFLQNIPQEKEKNGNFLEKLDELLINFVKARQKMFLITIKQMSLTFFTEGVILSSFFILGGYLVFEGKMPIGEFIASEIIIISITYALHDFIKQIDYMYDLSEGIYKIHKLHKLSTKLGEKNV